MTEMWRETSSSLSEEGSVSRKAEFKPVHGKCSDAPWWQTAWFSLSTEAAQPAPPPLMRTETLVSEQPVLDGLSPGDKIKVQKRKQRHAVIRRACC
mmetsp:Transcript_59937/g.138482  ORF Transcript_59937/g.138482 Transcript_59937/m.138482 type:complete len:96 (+) Transcript_59937:32-319(+)